MTDPLQQAIERSRDFEPDPGNAWQGPVFALQMEPKFREALAIADAALADVSHWDESLNDKGFAVDKHHALRMWRGCVATAEQARAEMRKLFEEDEGVDVNASYDEDEVLMMCVNGVLTLDQTAEMLGVSKDRFKAAIDKCKEAPHD